MHLSRSLYLNFFEKPYRFHLCVKYLPREDAGGLSREYVLRIPSVS